ncbi:MAG TPA: DNA-directed RNA polymerase subunit beta', partial [Bacilli bacterium]|nr:DNA-directed RNA polymerase subunit beta' [Bacilli bacterium]
EVNGRVKEINPKPDNRFQVIIESPIEGNNKEYLTDSGKKPVVKVGQEVKAGDLITADSELVHVLQLLRVTNVPNVERYILKEVQKVYRSQGVLISDKHIEIIIRQMLQKVMVLDEGDTDLLPGSLISKPKAYQAIKEMLEQNKRLPVLKPVLLSITQASLKSDSFLSAASFQETTRVLTATAIRGKIDTLDGLKENIIIGGLIPAGTGLVEKDDIDIESTTDEVYDIKP